MKSEHEIQKELKRLADCINRYDTHLDESVVCNYNGRIKALKWVLE